METRKLTPAEITAYRELAAAAKRLRAAQAAARRAKKRRKAVRA
jgi:hypothetical protein